MFLVLLLVFCDKARALNSGQYFVENACAGRRRCHGYLVAEKIDGCTAEERLADKVHIHEDKIGATWALSKVKGSLKDTYTISSYSRKPGCLRYLAASPVCAEKYLQLDAEDDGSGRQHWTLVPVKAPSPPRPRKSPPPPLSPPFDFVDIPAVNYSIAVTGYTSFGPSEQTAFCNSIYNSTSHPRDWMQCIVAFVTNVPYQESASYGRKLAQSGTVYVRGYTAFEFIYGNLTSQQEAKQAADDFYRRMNSPSALKTIFQSSFTSSTFSSDAVGRGEVAVPENTLPTPDSLPASPASPTSSSPSPTPNSPTLSPEFNTVPGGDGVSTNPPVTSPVPTPITIGSTPVPPPPPSPPPPSPPPPSPPPVLPVARTYVTNAGTFSLNVCVLDASGSFTTCQDTPASTINIHRPYGIGIIGYRLFMVANRDSYLVECTLSSTDGSVLSCTRNNLVSTLHNPLALKVYNSRVYITNYGDSTVSTCTVDSVSSSITGCAKPVPSSGSGWKLNQPYGIAFSNDRAYITSAAANKITVCTINPANGYFITCSDNAPTSGLGFNLASPTGIVILNNKAYIANSIYITICTISNTDGSLDTCTGNNAGLSTPYDMEILNLKLYIPNYGANTATVCALDATTGNILSCASTAPTSGLGFLMSNPYGIAIKTI